MTELMPCCLLSVAEYEDPCFVLLVEFEYVDVEFAISFA